MLYQLQRQIRTLAAHKSTMDRKEFDATKAGVKGLLESGITKIPKFFIRPSLETVAKSSCKFSDISLRIPLIDLAGFESSKRKDIIDEICEASEKWGVFQLINHGIPISVLDEMIAATKRFHEQPNEVKKELYSRDLEKSVKYYSNGDLFSRKGAADWTDILAFDFDDGIVDPAAVPQLCRDAVTEYVGHMVELKNTLSELLSEALGLSSDYLAKMECMEYPPIRCHYYPACPEPNGVLGSVEHTDPDFMTIVLQDNVGGLQVVQQNMWVDVSPVPGALIVNMGDFMQLITNDKFISVQHRVQFRQTGPRVSIVCFFYPSSTNLYKHFGPIEELLFDQEPIYRETSVMEYVDKYNSNGGPGSNPCLPLFKLV
ncbi:1-aminocyclopropane-1-carboxylate oxidase homolog 1-like isoform X2 [Tripterygium wilfordii]|uniref:1-aminocyclopropane-1-carboxylate oxidase homolog 1-like isoform X2 n=1 Tax=Tripterygium wilfordii TaxID=458696 RepID=UPI0018F7EA7C|nr:1-aminocyclopropane-1-carboxylate oxidase homolog 1-like isoform X2 [Tripterygium wilfordii]